MKRFIESHDKMGAFMLGGVCGSLSVVLPYGILRLVIYLAGYDITLRVIGQ